MQTKNINPYVEAVSKLAMAKAKTAALAQTNIKGEPGKDVKSEKTPDSTEKVNKDSIGANKQDQGYGQKHEDAEATPAKGAKAAEVNDLASSIIGKLKKSEMAQKNIKGKPGKE
jgi:hypothetical protein